MTDPAFYNDLSLTLEKAGALWREGAAQRRSPLHAPVVAGMADGVPQQRIMVLREVDWASRTLRFHTDRRSHKCGEFGDNAAVSVLGYHPDEKVQIRLTGTAAVLNEGPIFEKAWESSTLFARRCYLVDLAPGSVTEIPRSGLPADVEGRLPTEGDIIPAKSNFAVLLVTFDAMDWLYLANSGHRRAQFAHTESAAWQGRWCIP
jgi:pyridoxamine 5'-phosphate oxidase